MTEQLTDAALIRLGEDGLSLSLHRLVQAEFLYQITPVERQRFFEDTVHMLRQVFPRKGQAVAAESDWPSGDIYWPHCLALINRYQESRAEQVPLQPTMEFCRLLDDCSWYS